MDEIIGKALALAGDTHTVIFASALGQQPCLKYEDQGGKVFYRPRDFAAFTAWAGLDMPHEIQPVMSEEFHLIFQSPEAATAAESQLRTLTVDGAPAMRLTRTGNELMAGCGIFERLEGAPTLAGQGRPSRPFFELFYLADGLKSGMHHPDGILWIRGEDRRHHAHAGRIPLRSVAPTILGLYGIDAAEWMSGIPVSLAASPTT
jgi:hypothetical protein